MKFGQQLNESAVPEWRAKYLDYKLGKKKLKAVDKALRDTDRSPRQTRTPFAGSFRDGPVQDLFRRGWQEEEGRGGVGGGDSERTPRAAPRSVPIPTNERSPLNGAGDGRFERSQNRMARYGSIIGSPNNAEGGPLSQRWTRHTPAGSDGAPSLELPAPAIGTRSTPRHGASDSIAQSLTSLGDPALGTSPLRSTPRPSSIPPRRLQATGPSGASVPSLDRQRTPAGRRGSAPMAFVRRMFSSSDSVDFEARQPDVALEAYNDLDMKKADFFTFLEKELKKIETFYKSKEHDADERLNVLREQLHIMRDQRLEELEAAEEHKAHKHNHEGAAAGDKAGSPSSNDSPQHLGRGTARRILQAVNKVDLAIERAKNGQIGKTSRAMGKLGSPLQQRIDPGHQDYSRRPNPTHVNYREAKRKLKIALVEYYRGLELLKSYAMTNRTAFRKMLKKYDKTVNYTKPSNRTIAEQVNASYFVNSDVVDNHIRAVEDLYARYFERGSHKIAVNKLRAKVNKADDFTGSIWRQGVMATAGLVFGIEGLVYGVEKLYQPNEILKIQTSFLLQIYAGYFLLLLLVALFVFDCRVFSRARVNYQFIFEFDPRHTLDWRQLSEMPALSCFLLGLIMWLNFNRFGGDTMFIYWPVLLIGLTVLLFILPSPAPYFKSRAWFLRSNWRTLLSGAYPVEFRDFFLGDMYCSQTYAFGNIELFFCLYAHHWNSPPQCNSSNSRLFGFFQTLPGIIRALQCLRRYGDTRNMFPHLANFGKYTFNILAYMSLSLYRIDRNDSLLALFIAISTINSLYAITWDIFMDWSLGDAYSKPRFLRTTLAYKQHWWYYTAMVLDVILRFNWIFYVIFRHDTQHSTVVSFFISFSEVIRRGIWVVFRVENEHCTNVGKFRASRDVSLPYDVMESATGSVDIRDDIHHPNENENDTDKGRPSDADEASFGGMGESPNSATLARHTSHTTGADLERQPSNSGTVKRSRRASSAVGTPVSRALRRVGSTVAAAHSQDYERRKKSEAVEKRTDGADDDDDDDDDYDDLAGHSSDED